MKAYKGFNKDMTCRGFQYEEGKEYETDKAVCCESGFHACEYPLDVFSYYSPNLAEFHEVELDGDIDKNNDDSKVSATKIKIGAKLNIAGIVKAAIEYTKEKTTTENDATGYYSASSATGYKAASSATGNYSASSATGYYSASSATGNCSASSATGYKAASSATGNYSASSATGYYSASSATGYYSASSATGNYSASSATGYYSASSATGNCSASSATGNYSASSATGYYSASSATGNCSASSATGYKAASSATNQTGIAVAWGPEAMASGSKGTTLVLADWRYIWDVDSNGDYDDPLNLDNWEFHGGHLYVVDGVNIKENTFYSMINGNLTEVTR